MPLVSLTVKPKVPHLSPSSGEPTAHSFFKVAVIAAFPLNGNETRQLSVFPGRILQDSLSLREAGCREGAADGLQDMLAAFCHTWDKGRNFG